jgi:hypothetical protein
MIFTTSSLPTCPLREEKSFSQRAFSIYTDIRKLQDKAKTSYTLSTRRLRFGYEQQFSRSTPGACFRVVGEELTAYRGTISTSWRSQNEAAAKAIDADLSGPEEEREADDRMESAAIVAEDKGAYQADREGRTR